MPFDLSAVEKYSVGDNLRSLFKYSSKFLSCSPKELKEKDILALPLISPGKSYEHSNKFLDGYSIPFLLNGSNNYAKTRAKLPEFVKLPSFVEQTFSLNGQFVVMPESQTVYELMRSGSGLSQLPLALNWWITSYQSQFALTRVFLEALVDFNSIHALRFFDSHLSMNAYTLFCLSYLSFIGFDDLSFSSVVNLLSDALLIRHYVPDLAVRFSDFQGFAYFPSKNLIVAREASVDGRQRGSYFKFFNKNSALTDFELFLFGDSHSFSALSPLFSQLFGYVHFYWGIPEDFPEFIEQYSCTSNPRLLVECSERFFLKNSQVE